MPTMEMTKAKIAKLPAPDPSGKQVMYWAEGSDHPGLGILVSGTTSAKSWIIQAKLPRTGVARRVTLGPVAVLSLKEAWEQARPVLAEIHSGVDPKAKRHRPATVREALEQYLKNPKLAPKTKADYRSRAERHLSDWLDLPIAEITPNMAEARFYAITDEVEARRAAGLTCGGVNISGAATANTALSIFRSLWRDQKKRDPKMATLLEPTALLSGKWHELERRERYVEPEQMPAFYAAIHAMRPDSENDRRPGKNRLWYDLLTLALYTGWREQELCGLRWSEVSLTEKMVRIAAERMKNRQAFELPLSRQIADLLIARRALGRDGDYVFGGGPNRPYQSMHVALNKVTEATGIRVSPHDMRRTFISIAENCTITPFELKRLVAHTTKGDVTSGYVQKTRDQLRRAAQIVADRIDELCGIAPVEGAERIAS
jgi:integrase